MLTVLARSGRALSAGEFVEALSPALASRLPADLGGFRAARDHGRPEVHFEGWHHARPGRFEVGLNAAAAARLRGRMIEVKRGAPRAELEAWDRGRCRLCETFPAPFLDGRVLQEAAARTADCITTLQPMLEDFPQMDPLEARNLFPLVSRWIFMNHAGVSPISDRCRAAVENVLRQLTDEPVAGDWMREAADGLRERLGRLLNCPADTIALTRSTAHGLSLLAGGLDWKPGDNVVGARGEYPANVYPWMSLRRRGVEFRMASNKGGRVSAEQVLLLVDDRTRVVALSHVEFWNGYRVDIEAIGRECRRRGVLVAVDAIQSAGALRIDLSRLPIDLLAAGGGKWLLGPVGIGFAYVTPELTERLAPPLVGTGSVRNRTEYFRYDLTFGETARRFEESSPSPIDVAALTAAVDLLLEVGPEAVEARVLSLAGRLAEGLDGAGYEIVGPWPRAQSERSGIVSFKKPGAPATEILRDLNASRIVGLQHADFVRLSPHFYNTEEEVDRVLEVLAPQAVR